MKVVIQHGDDLTLDDLTTGTAVHGKQSSEVRRTIDAAISTVELVGRQLF